MRFVHWIGFFLLSGCVTWRTIDIGEDKTYAKYKCLIPKHKVILAMTWDTCPMLSFKPAHAYFNARWKMHSIVTETNKRYLEFELSKQSKLDKNDKNCTLPTLIDEIVEVPANSEVHVTAMETFSDTVGEGVSFEGVLTVSDTQYLVSYSGLFACADNRLGYDIESKFDTCSGSVPTSQSSPSISQSER